MIKPQIGITEQKPKQHSSGGGSGRDPPDGHRKPLPPIDTDSSKERKPSSRAPSTSDEEEEEEQGSGQGDTPEEGYLSMPESDYDDFEGYMKGKLDVRNWESSASSHMGHLWLTDCESLHS